jgi:endonuclease/exonuclease/phosphatase family metal-dependent hydrolase
MRIAFLNFGFGMAVTKGAWQMIWYPRYRKYPAVISRIAKFIQEERIEVIGLTEVNFPGERDALRTATGMNIAGDIVYRNRLVPFMRQGNVLLTRYPIRSSATFPLPGEGQPRAVVTADVETPSGIITFLVTHLGLGERSRRLQIAALADICRNLPNPFILMGDLNVMNTEELAPLAASRLMRHLESGPTYPSWKPKREFDHILISPNIESGNVFVYNKERFSDHLALVVDLVPNS